MAAMRHEKHQADKYVMVYDFGDSVGDRFTIVFKRRRSDSFDTRLRDSVGASLTGLWSHHSAMPGRHLGKRLRFEQLPDPVRQQVIQEIVTDNVPIFIRKLRLVKTQVSRKRRETRVFAVLPEWDGFAEFAVELCPPSLNHDYAIISAKMIAKAWPEINLLHPQMMAEEIFGHEIADHADGWARLTGRDFDKNIDRVTDEFVEMVASTYETILRYTIKRFETHGLN